MMREFYAVSVCETGDCELIGMFTAENLRGAREIVDRKYHRPDLLVIGRDGYRARYMEKCTGEKPEEGLWKNEWN